MSQKQKPNLAAALAEIGGSTRRQHVAEAKENGSESKEIYQQPSRADTAPITAHFPRQVRDQLKILAIERGSTLQNLVAEAYNDLFAKYGKPEIAPHQSMIAEK